MNDQNSGPAGRALSVAGLEQLLDVDPTSDGWRGSAFGQGNGRVFGGQIVAQALVSAMRALASDQRPHSLHAYFIRAGNEAEPIDYRVTINRRGRSYSTIRVDARQDQGTIVSLLCSFQSAEPGLEFQLQPLGVPSPEAISAPAGRALKGGLHPLEVRLIPSDMASNDASEKHRRLAWFRTVAPISEDPSVRLAVLAYASDLLLLGTSVAPLGISLRTPGLRAASLDHAIWFHRDAPLHEWMLYSSECLWSGLGRSLTRGGIFTREGALIASVTQEAMVRVPEGAVS